MKSHFFQKLFETIVVIAGMVVFGCYLSANTHVEPLIVKNDVRVQSDKNVCVTLEGEVNYPGDYIVPQGTMLYNVLREAGGVTADADLSSFDLSALVIYDTIEFIPEKSDGILVERCIPGDVEGAVSETKVSGLININTASVRELCTLPGIGEATAADIVHHRAQNGNFVTIEDIKDVKGIGDKTFEKINDFITVGE